MKAIYAFLWVLLLSLNTVAQVDVTATGGTPSAVYPTLKAAFDQVNMGIHTGTISIGISGNTTETVPVILNASGSGAASYTAITISPTGGTARTITGNFDDPLIDLNGADQVTIDGLNTGGNSLTIVNVNTGSSAVAIRFIADATNNLVTRCTIRGASGAGNTSGISSGIVYFANGSSNTTGNDNNTISNNTIGPTGSNLTPIGIYSLGIQGGGGENSGNNITNNAIFDCFNPYIGTSAGIYLDNSNTGWTITGNSIYQTAVRSSVNANTRYGIHITSGSGHTISNNFIGGSSPSALGTAFPTLGITGNRFVGINLAVAASTATSVQGNTIANIALTTNSTVNTANGVFCGINIVSGNVNVGTSAANIIGATSGTDNIRVTPSASGGLLVGINSSSTGMVFIQNNIIGSLTSESSSATISTSITGINVSGIAASMTISGNTIGNTTADNIRCGINGLTTTVSQVSGISLPIIPAGNIVISGNTIRNLSAYGTGFSYVRGIWTETGTGSPTVFSVTGNSISLLTTNSTLPGVTLGWAAAVGINVATGNNNIIAQNTIHAISSINTGTSANYVVGITTASATNTTITRNRIYNLSNAGTSISTTSPSVAAGIVVRSGTTSVTLSNNMISLGNGQGTNTAFIGIQCNNGSTPDPVSRIYYNTINIEGTVLNGAQPSFGIVRTDFGTIARTAPVDIKNNIVNNTRSGGTGGHFAIGNHYGATASSTGWGSNASNYNLLNANAASVGNWGGTTRLSFISWKSSSASDGNSLTAKPITFVNTITGNLRLNMGTTPTSIESAGTVIAGIANDFDNDTRPGPAGSVNGAGYAPDLGADEFDGVYLDIVPPTISYTPLALTCDTGARTLIVTIADFSGVPVTGTGLPRLYWKKNSDPYTTVTGTHIGGNQYQFVFGSGVTLSDFVYYYVVAQDNAAAPNISAFPATGASVFTANPPGSSPPNTPNTYYLIEVLPAGTYSIGTGGNYLTLESALFDYNTSCLVGPVVFEMRNGTYTTSGVWNIIKHPDASAVNTLTIKPASGATVTISSSTPNNPALRILGNHVTIDGSNNGTNSRNLSIRNSSNTSNAIAIVIGSTGASPITNVTIKNCNINNTSALTTKAVQLSNGSVYADSGYFNHINLANNRIYSAAIGIHANAVTAAGNGTGLLITDNLMNGAGSDAIGNGGIFLKGVDGAVVSGNNMGNFETTTVESDFGISLYNCSNTVLTGNTIDNLAFAGSGSVAPTGIRVDANMPVSGITISGNTINGLSSSGGATGVSTNGIFVTNGVTGVTIGQNKISQITNTNTTGWGAHGILLNTTSNAANITVANNFIANVAAHGFPLQTVDDNGHGISVNAGAGYHIFHNTVNLAINQVVVDGLPSAFYVSSGVTMPGAINLRNNIFCNRQTGGSTERYGILSYAPSSVFATIDYNDYYTAGPNLAFIGTARSNLAALQSGFGGNANSLDILPVFISNTDLHLNTNENTALDNKGGPVGTVAVDIDSISRSAITPDMGASEFAFLGYCAAVNVSFVSNISGGNYQWQVDTGTGYVDIANGGVYAGATGATLTLVNPSTSLANNKYRCVVDGTGFSAVHVYNVGTNWTGASSTEWTDAGNWSCGFVPDQFTNVQINKGSPNYPVLDANVTIKSLLLLQGAGITVGLGAVLLLTGR